MKYKGKIKQIDHIVISDPIYKKEVQSRYEKENIKEKNWFVDLCIYPVELEENYNEKGIQFSLLLQKNKNDCRLNDDGTLSCFNNVDFKDFKIGMDSACVALGLNDKAKEIIDCVDEWQPLCAIETGTDGTFGELLEGTEKGKLRFLFIEGYFNRDLINQDELLEYLKEQFEITDLVMEDDDSYYKYENLNDEMGLKEYILNNEVRSGLDDLQARLQADYNGGKVFEQYEEDRIILGNILDMIDSYEKQNNMKNLELSSSFNLVLYFNKEENMVHISSFDGSNAKYSCKDVNEFTKAIETFCNNHLVDYDKDLEY